LSRSEIIAPQGVPVQPEEAARVVENSTARVTPIAGHARNTTDRTYCHSAPTVALQTDTNADAGRARVGESLAQVNNVLARESGDRRCS